MLQKKKFRDILRPMETFICNECPNKCNVNRTTNVGICGVGVLPRVSRVGLHPWEEPVISGEKGSGTIFFAGCNLRCVFCQNYQISHRLVGKTYTYRELADAMRSLVDQGAHNINFVTPSHYAYAVERALAIYRPPVPVVYNSSAYDDVETLKRLEGLVDVYLPDYKYDDPNVAAKYSGAEDYPSVAWAAIAEMHRQQPRLVIEDGLMKKGLVVRHLVLPTMSTESKRIVEKLYNEYGDSIYLSVMSQYVPMGDAAAYPEINRTLVPLEYTRVVAALNRLGAANVFVQDAAAASDVYVPPFDGE